MFVLTYQRGVANKCGSAKVTTPSLRATPPWEENLKTLAYVLADAEKIPLLWRGARRAGWFHPCLYTKPQKFATPISEHQLDSRIFLDIMVEKCL